MVRRLRLYAVVAVVLGGLTAGSYAIAAGFGGRHEPPQSSEFKAQLNGYQETPAVSSTGSGELWSPRGSTTSSRTRGSRAARRSSRTSTSESELSPAASRSSSAGAAVIPLPARISRAPLRTTSRPPTSSGRTDRASSQARLPRSCARCVPGPRTRTSTRPGGRSARSAARSTTWIRSSSRDSR